MVHSVMSSFSSVLLPQLWNQTVPHDVYDETMFCFKKGIDDGKYKKQQSAQEFNEPTPRDREQKARQQRRLILITLNLVSCIHGMKTVWFQCFFTHVNIIYCRNLVWTDKWLEGPKPEQKSIAAASHQQRPRVSQLGLNQMVLFWSVNRRHSVPNTLPTFISPSTNLKRIPVPSQAAREWTLLLSAAALMWVNSMTSLTLSLVWEKLPSPRTLCIETIKSSGCNHYCSPTGQVNYWPCICSWRWAQLIKLLKAKSLLDS